MHHPTRRSQRLPTFDYGTDGWYFITTCTAGRQRLFADIVDDNLKLTRLGEIVEEVWRRTSMVDSRVGLDISVVMPDHLHAILSLDGLAERAESHKSLSSIVGGFKAAASREMRALNPDLGRIWQRGFYDRVIRSDAELARIRHYVETNPTRWILRVGSKSP